MPRFLSGKLIIYLVLLLILDLCLMPLVRFGMIYPVLLYLMVPYAAFVWRWEKTTPIALFVGLLRDITGSQPFGVEMVSLVVSAHLLDLFVQKIEREALIMRLVTNFLFVFVQAVFILIIFSVFGGPVRISGYTLLMSFGMALSTTVVLPVFFYITAVFFRDRPPLKQYELFG